MTRLPLKFAATALAFSLAACGEPMMEAEMVAETMTSPYDVTDLRYVFNGAEADSRLKDNRSLKDALDKMGGGPKTNNLRSMIERVRTANGGKGKPSLSGLGGIPGHAFLDAAGMGLKGNGQFQLKTTLEVHGKIDLYEFNDADGSGRIHSTTFYTRSITTPAGQVIANTEAYKWQVRVEPGGFTVHDKAGHPDSDPFPGTIPFSQAMLDRIRDENYTHKLWAKGTKIVVERVELDKNYDPANPNFIYLDPTAPQFKEYWSLYDTNDESCIDMLFKIYPPHQLPANAAPPLYCLGRCQQPALINTW